MALEAASCRSHGVATPCPVPHPSPHLTGHALWASDVRRDPRLFTEVPLLVMVPQRVSFASGYIMSIFLATLISSSSSDPTAGHREIRGILTGQTPRRYNPNFQA